ncbi:hypothetical protein LGMT14_00199 [Lactococcus garvieae]|nr:hypothetical protein NALG_1390 [Lactococcus formosensis]CEF50352.1 hypothetical protein LGMT14_00199 [Lactococcus garvieae]
MKLPSIGIFKLILDYYGYHHNAYDEAKALLFELCWFELVG